MLNRKFMKSIIRIVISLTILSFISNNSFSQADSSYNRIDLSYKDYIKMVVDGNIEYIIEKYNVNIADAKIEAARVFQDPTISLDRMRAFEGESSDNYEVTAGLSKIFELGQKRKARINLAKSESDLTSALLGEYLRNLLADATLDYLTALKQVYLYDVMQNSWQMMKELSEADSIRLSLGSIKSIDATQSKIEAGILFNDLLQIDADRRNAFLNLSIRTSSYHSDTLIFPAGKFDKPERTFELNELLISALNNRADLLAARSNIKYNRDFLALTKSERAADIDLSIGATDAYTGNNIMSPDSYELFAGIAVPIKFSNFNKGELKVAKFQIEQGEMLYKQVEMKIRNEVVQAFIQYQSSCRQVENYDQGLLDQAKTVLNGKIYSYSRGETSLLEVLNAQRTYNDLQTSYYETMYSCHAALVELERAVGTNNMEL